MIKVDGEWWQVQPGHYILDKTGALWRVSDIEVTSFVQTEDVVHLAGAGDKMGRISRPKSDTPVTLVILSTAELLEHELGAKEVS